MRSLLAVVAFLSLLQTLPANAQQPEPCRLLTMQAVAYDMTAGSTGYSGEGDVQCKDEYTNPYQGMFSARTWMLDETSGTTVSEDTLPACTSGLACTGRFNWTGSLGGLFTGGRGHCYRARTSASSSFYNNEVGTAQKCDPGPNVADVTGGGSTPAIDPTSGTYYEELPCFPGIDAWCSPIVINFENGGYRLTGKDSPVRFDIRGDGHPLLMGWTAAGANEAFLWLDRNHDHTVTSGAQLFGNFTPLRNGQFAKNGFEALAEFDDNHDGVIDNRDAVWPQLLLWRDLNHDGISQPDEITSLESSGVTAIDLHYHWNGRRDTWGNAFRYESLFSIKDEQGHSVHNRSVYDIFFVSVQ